MRPPFARAAAACAAALSLAACSNLPGSSGFASLSSLSSLAPGAPDKAVVKTAGELPPPPAHTWPDAKQDLNDHRADGWGLVSMPEMEQYLNTLLQKIKVATGTTDWPVTVHITSDTSLNASSTAAGNIYIPLGWIMSAESEDEIFAILSHEYGHIYLNHYAVYDVRNAGDASAILASVTWSVVNRNVVDRGWNGLDKIALVQSIGTTVLMPAWQRSIEEQADLFGATVSLRCGYSYIYGFKAFLERIDSYDTAARERDEKLQKAQDDAMHDKIRADTLAKIPKSPATAASGASAAVAAAAPLASSDAQPSGPAQALQGINDALAKLNDTLAQGQVSLNTGAYDAQRTLDRALAKGMASLRDTHPEGEAREDDLSKAVEGLIAGKRPPATTAPWQAARKQRHTKEVLAHYAMLGDIDMLEAQQRYAEAYRLAQKAASGATANDAAPDFYLANLLALSHARSNETPAQILARNQRAPERSWRVQVQLADAMAASNRAQARAFLEAQFAWFGQAPQTWPDMIAFYRDTGDVQRGKQMALTCGVNFPNYRAACSNASMTPAELAQIKAKTDAHARMIVDNVSHRWFRQ
ncbi:M48 family metalloprotease [Paraburkholderia lycopersici]|uniref:Putative Zn-dependent protease, contains TPR repeats n=1 Tax=Paraburkholderia lycopersici TaxID=416944 RepID=A0A1G6NTB3_9BURK|nr:M48 family metalloprotease [Paraburkholderia lycopersici]SDC70998.1 Putative Zn-dependent protease, contains TPR repeats [Paraburkholderia lycopersici]